MNNSINDIKEIYSSEKRLANYFDGYLVHNDGSISKVSCHFESNKSGNMNDVSVAGKIEKLSYSEKYDFSSIIPGGMPVMNH